MSDVEVAAVAEVPGDATVLAVPVLRGPRPVPGSPVEPDLRHLEAAGFAGEVGEVHRFTSAEGRLVAAVGVGEADEMSADTFRKGAAAVVQAAGKAEVAATTLLAAAEGRLDAEGAARAVAEGAVMGAYRFTAHKSSPAGAALRRLAVVAPGAGAELQRALDRGRRVGRAVCLARDLANEPAGGLTPRRLADVALDVAQREGLRARVLDEAAIDEAGLGGLAGVARGSAEPPRLVELAYEPPGDAAATVVLVGKGITFDSGGLSIKTADGMMTMKTDMSGAAAVLATMSALPALAPAVRVVGLMPLAENMPGGAALKPGDVVRIRNGRTVEVLNTDAEGRLVLADALSLAAERRPDAIVDLATLTGAQVVALGRNIAGLMGNDDGLVDRVRRASERAGEPAWPLPLPAEYRSHLDSEVADVKNIGNPGQAGTLVAGLFLQEFVGGVPWAHLDIAGPARAESDEGYVKKGATGAGVRTLLELLTTFPAPG